MDIFDKMRQKRPAMLHRVLHGLYRRVWCVPSYLLLHMHHANVWLVKFVGMLCLRLAGLLALEPLRA